VSKAPSFRAGAEAVQGHHQVTIFIRDPQNVATKLSNVFDVNFTTDDPAEVAQLTLDLVMLGNQPPGQYLIDVKWDNESLTSIPLQIQKGAQA
jgi:hypothetical protein